MDSGTLSRREAAIGRLAIRVGQQVKVMDGIGRQRATCRRFLETSSRPQRSCSHHKKSIDESRTREIAWALTSERKNEKEKDKRAAEPRIPLGSFHSTWFPSCGALTHSATDPAPKVHLTPFSTRAGSFHACVPSRSLDTR